MFGQQPSGTPTVSGTFNVTITATDSSGGSGPFTGSRAYSLAVGHLGASRAALFPSFVPALATLLAMPMLGQVPDALQATGILLASLGLLTALDLFGRKAAQ